MSNLVTNLMKKVKTKPSAKSVLMALADYSDDNGYCYPSMELLSEDTCLCVRAVKTAIKDLETACLLTVDRSNGRHNKYQINLKPVHIITKPVQDMHQCSKNTSASNAPTSAGYALEPVQDMHQPVQDMHTNHQYTSLEPSINQEERVLEKPEFKKYNYPDIENWQPPLATVNDKFKMAGLAATDQIKLNQELVQFRLYYSTKHLAESQLYGYLIAWFKRIKPDKLDKPKGFEATDAIGDAWVKKRMIEDAQHVDNIGHREVIQDVFT